MIYRYFTEKTFWRGELSDSLEIPTPVNLFCKPKSTTTVPFDMGPCGSNCTSLGLLVDPRLCFVEGSLLFRRLSKLLRLRKCICDSSPLSADSLRVFVFAFYQAWKIFCSKHSNEWPVNAYQHKLLRENSVCSGMPSQCCPPMPLLP